MNKVIKKVKLSDGSVYDIEPAQTEELVIIAQDPTLTPGAESTIGHVGGVDFKVTMPEFPDITISTGKTETSTADTVTAISKLEQNTADGHEITVSKTTLPTKAYVDKIATGHVKYLGTVSALTKLSTTAGQGDFYRVSTEFTFGSEKAHVGDIILATKDNPAQNATDWDLIHAEIDSNTWVANSASAAGYVAKGSGKAHQVWKTDANGNPGWRTDADTEYSAGTGLSLSETTFSVNYGTTASTACVGNDSRLSDKRTPKSHTHGNITNDGLLGTANRVVITDGNKKITTSSSISTTELGYLDGVSSNIQTQLDGKTPTSVLPADGGEIETKYRCSKKGNTSTVWYYPLCTLPKNDSGNYASVIISGRIGGWESGNMSYINALVWNRGTPGISVITIGGTSSSAASITDLCRLELYVESNGTAKLYARCTSYFTFDLDLELFQETGSITYNGTYSTSVTGTLSKTSANTSNRLELINGELYVAGKKMPTMSYNSSTGVLTITG